MEYVWWLIGGQVVGLVLGVSLVYVVVRYLTRNDANGFHTNRKL